MQQIRFNRICVTDLDGTLLNDDHIISKPNLEALHEIGRRGICRVAATGRSLFSVRKVLSPDAPFDYVIFTTGAGVMNWQKQSIIQTRLIDKSLILRTWNKLLELSVDFFLHAPIPDNHHFIAIRGRGQPDFDRRVSIYREFGYEWDGKSELPWEEATQFLIIASEGEVKLMLKLMRLLSPLRIIHITSPLDHLTTWFEVFAPEVSKGSAVEYLLGILSLDAEQMMVIGNDFNDKDMLLLTEHAYVTANSPAALQASYKVVSDHNHSGFAEAVRDWMN